MTLGVDDYGHLGPSTESTCQPMWKISHYRDRVGSMPRVVQKCSGSPATSIILCNCTGELCVHPVHLFTKLGTCPLTKSGGFPPPCDQRLCRGPWDGYFFAVGLHVCGEQGSGSPWTACYGCYASYNSSYVTDIKGFILSDTHFPDVPYKVLLSRACYIGSKGHGPILVGRVALPMVSMPA